MKDFTATKKINLSDQKSLSRTILKKDLIAAIKTANEKITSENFLNEDEFITSFGCKNIEEYLDYLAALKTDSIANAEKTQSLINKDSIKAESSIAAENYQSLINKDSIKAESSIAAENYQSRQFFHIFLLEFHRIRAARSLAKVDNELNEYQKFILNNVFSLTQFNENLNKVISDFSSLTQFNENREKVIEDFFSLKLSEADKEEPNLAKNYFANLFAIGRDDSKIADFRKRISGDITEAIALGNTPIYYTESIGYNYKLKPEPREKQEDAFIIGFAKGDFASANSSRIPYLLKREMENFGSKVSEICDFSSLSDGSTANIIHYSTDQILTIGNCGDSRAVLFIIGDDGNFYYKRLTNDHDPEDIIEKARVENIEAGRVSDGRIWGDNRIGLSLSRSFGDLPISADRQRLISQEVDIYQYDIAKIKQKYGAGSKIFLMNSCDGMYDNSRSNEKIYAAALKNWHEQESLRMKWKNNPAEYLRDFSMALGSVDNITTCFFDITLAPTQPIINGIFDGHCGDRVSSLAADYFGKTLLQENSIIHFQNQNFVNNFGQTMLSLTTDERGVITKESFVINPNLEDLTTKDLLGNSYYDQDYITLLTTAYALEKKFKTEEISGKNLLVKKSNIVYFEADPDNSFSAEKISQATERVLDILTNERPEITQAQIFFLIDIKNNWQVVEINFSKTAENKFLVNQIYFNCEQDQINSHQELIQNSLGDNQSLILNSTQNNVILPIEAKNSGPLICQYLGTRLGEINADHQTIIFSPEELLNLRVEQIKLASKNLGLQYAYDFYISDCNPRSEDLLDFESDFSDSDNKEQKLNYSSNNSELKKPSAKTLKNNQHEHHN